MGNELTSLNKIPLFGFILLPFLLVSGPFLPDLITVLSCFYFFIYKKIKLSFESRNKEIIFFLVFFIYLNFNSLLNSENLLISLKVSVPYFRYFFFMLVLIFFLSKTENFKNNFFFSCLICLSILTFDSIYQLTTGSNIFGYKIYQDRISSFFGDELILGSFTFKIFIILLTLSCSLEYSKKNIRYFHILIFLISYLLIVISNERVSLAYFIVLFLFYCLIELNLKKNIIILFTFILLNCFTYFIYPKAFERLIFHSINQFKSSETFFLSSYRHDLHYYTAIEMFKEKPIIGHGLKSFRYKCDNPSYKVKDKIIIDKSVYAHDDGIIKKEGNTFFLIDKKNHETVLGLTSNKISENKLTKFQEVKKGEYIASFYEFENGCNTHPHQTHLQFLSELGLVGYIFLIVFIYFLIKEVFKLLKKKFLIKAKLNKFESAYFICLIGLLLHINPILPSGSFFNNYNSIVFFMLVAFLIYFRNQKEIK